MVMPIGHDTNGSMFPPSPFNLTENNDYCKKLYGVEPRPHWVTTYYGGQVYIYIYMMMMMMSCFSDCYIFMVDVIGKVLFNYAQRSIKVV
jgi:hypothetical protein